MATEKWLDLGTENELTRVDVGGVWKERNQKQANLHQS